MSDFLSTGWGEIFFGVLDVVPSLSYKFPQIKSQIPEGQTVFELADCELPPDIFPPKAEVWNYVFSLLQRPDDIDDRVVVQLVRFAEILQNAIVVLRLDQVEENQRFIYRCPMALAYYSTVTARLKFWLDPNPTAWKTFVDLAQQAISQDNIIVTLFSHWSVWRAAKDLAMDIGKYHGKKNPVPEPCWGK